MNDFANCANRFLKNPVSGRISNHCRCEILTVCLCLFSESLRFVFGLLVPRGVEDRGLAADRAVAIAVMVVELEGLLENLGEMLCKPS